MSRLRSYLLSVCAVSLLSSVLPVLLPQGRIRQVIKLSAGVLVMLAVISPIMQLDTERLARSLAMLRMQTEQMQNGIEVGNREILAELIKEDCEAYILDKAEQLGLDLEIEIVMREEGDYPYPVAVTLHGEAAAAERSYMERVIEQDIGIPLEKQEWINDG